MGRPEDREHDPRVYFVRGETSDLIKIGTTTAFRNRMNSLRTPHTGEITVLAHMPGGREDEQWIHKQLAEHRVHGEWFRPHPDVLEWVDIAKGANQAIPRGQVKNGKMYYLAGAIQRVLPEISTEDAFWMANDRPDIAHLLYKGFIRDEHRQNIIEHVIVDYVERSDAAWFASW